MCIQCKQTGLLCVTQETKIDSGGGKRGRPGLKRGGRGGGSGGGEVSEQQQEEAQQADKAAEMPEHRWGEGLSRLASVGLEESVAVYYTRLRYAALHIKSRWLSPVCRQRSKHACCVTHRETGQHVVLAKMSLASSLQPCGVVEFVLVLGGTTSHAGILLSAFPPICRKTLQLYLCCLADTGAAAAQGGLGPQASSIQALDVLQAGVGYFAALESANDKDRNRALAGFGKLSR